MAESEHGAPLRIGILGAARIAPMALINPAKENAEVVVAAVAARDASRTQAFAAKHKIARMHEDYDKTTPEDAIENMTVIDANYRAADLPLRNPS